MKIFLIAPSATHYRETFYQKLIDANPQHEWLVIDGEKKIDDGRPTYYKQFSFPHKRFEETFKKLGPFSLRDYVGLLDFVKEKKPDLVVTQTIVGAKVYRDIANMARNGAFKLVLWSCLWEHPDVKRNLFRAVKNMVLKRYLNSASYHIAYSSYAKQKLLEFDFPEDKIFIAYNGIETDGMEALRIDEEKRKKIKEKLEIKDNAKVFLYVGGLGPDKNVKLLLEALLLLKESNLHEPFAAIIIGDGPQQGMLKDFVSSNKMNGEVKFLGRIVKGVDEYFQCCDCLVLPGAGGLALNQAMYWQKPCIVSHADGTEEDLVIEGETGFRFEFGNVESLKEALLRFFNTSEEKLQQMGVRGNALIRKQSNVNEMIVTFDKVFNLIQNEVKRII